MSCSSAVFTFQSYFPKSNPEMLITCMSTILNKTFKIFYLLSHGVQTSGLITVFAIKLCPLADFVFKVYPPMFGLGLKTPSESEPDVRASIFGAEGYSRISTFLI